MTSDRGREPNWPEKSISVRIECRHLVSDAGGQLLLLDTGSPISFGPAEIGWRGRTIDVAPEPAQISLDEINDAIGRPFAGLIGADLLLEQPCTLNLQNDSLGWHDSRSGVHGCLLEQWRNVPIATLSVAGRPARFAVDTGASWTYVDSETAEGMERVGTVEDFYPGRGRFTAERVPLEVSIDGHESTIQAAVLPEELNDLKRSFNITGIIGLDVLEKGAFSLDARAGIFSPAVEISRG